MNRRFPIERSDPSFLNPHRKNTINRVTQRLAPKLRDRIRQLWKTANCMDLNYSTLDEYLSVINQRFEQANKENEHRMEALISIGESAVAGAEFSA
jgi:hypothetical protein